MQPNTFLGSYEVFQKYKVQILVDRKLLTYRIIDKTCLEKYKTYFFILYELKLFIYYDIVTLNIHWMYCSLQCNTLCKQCCPTHTLQFVEVVIQIHICLIVYFLRLNFSFTSSMKSLLFSRMLYKLYIIFPLYLFSLF